MPPQHKYYCPNCEGGIKNDFLPAVVVDTVSAVYTRTFTDCTFSVTHEGVIYTEDVKYDLTAIELYKLNKIKEIAAVNLHMPEEIIKRIKSMGTERHFKVEGL